MNALRLAALATALSCLACIHPTRVGYHFDEELGPINSGPDLQVGQTIAQGMIGLSLYDQVERSGGTTPPSGPQPDDLERMPTLGGAWQTAFGDGPVDWGFEFGATIGYRNSNGTVSSGGADMQVDVALSLFDLFGGAFLSRSLDDKARVYVGAGPLLQVANYWQKGFDMATASELKQHGTGLGLGYYGRAGIEFETSFGMMVGLGVRWLDSEVSIDDGLGKLDVRGAQVFVTFSRSY